MIHWIQPPWKRGDQVVIVLRNGKRLRAEVTVECAPSTPWPPHMVFRAVKTRETFTTIGAGPQTVIGICTREEKADDEKDANAD